MICSAYPPVMWRVSQGQVCVASAILARSFVGSV